MAYREDERTMGVDLPVKLFDEFNKQRKKRGQVKKDAVRTMVKLWVQLPEEVQAKLLNQSLDGKTFINLVRQIADEQITKRQKKKTSK
jgi:hypothetical protein